MVKNCTDFANIFLRFFFDGQGEKEFVIRVSERYRYLTNFFLSRKHLVKINFNVIVAFQFDRKFLHNVCVKFVAVCSDDVRYCSLRVGEQKQNTKQTQGTASWQDTCSFLVHQLKCDKVSPALYIVTSRVCG